MTEKRQLKFPVTPDVIPTATCVAKETKRRKTGVEKAATKKRWIKQEIKPEWTSESLFKKWRQLRELKGLKSDTMFAAFLLEI